MLVGELVAGAVLVAVEAVPLGGDVPGEGDVLVVLGDGHDGVVVVVGLVEGVPGGVDVAAGLVEPGSAEPDGGVRVVLCGDPAAPVVGVCCRDVGGGVGRCAVVVSAGGGAGLAGGTSRGTAGGGVVGSTGMRRPGTPDA